MVRGSFGKALGEGKMKSSMAMSYLRGSVGNLSQKLKAKRARIETLENQLVAARFAEAKLAKKLHRAKQAMEVATCKN